MSDESRLNTASPASACLPSAKPSRGVLRDVSPNVRSTPPAPGKMLSGSPLKRTFTAAMDNDQGFRYLKRRRFSIDSPLSQMMTAEEAAAHESVDAGALPVVCDLDSLPVIEQIEPTRPNTPDEPASEEADGQDSSIERKSFSSLINYDPSSQPAPNSHQSSGLVFNGPSYAELLRLRLRVAMFKVRTDQTHVPFADLEAADASEPEDRTAAPSSAGVNGAAHRHAQRLSPAPDVLPAQSSRVMYEVPAPQSPDNVRGDTISTPRERRTTGRPDEQELTSSIVKGRVAEGLLGLRNAY